MCFSLATGAWFAPLPAADAPVVRLTVLFLAVVGLGFAANAWFHRWTTEIGVTDRRVVYKKGFISRQTTEMNMDKVETVLVDQGLAGRLLNFGTITIKGAGESIERLPRIADPLTVRNAITAR